MPYYLHGDQIGSTVFKTDDPSQGDPAMLRRTVRTAFGEVLGIGYDVGTQGWQPCGGEECEGPYGRYGYAGAWGYEEQDVCSIGLILAGDPAAGAYDPDGLPDSVANARPTVGFPYIHTGYRYYDPATGRFLQRDPIGIDGGMNVYAYVDASPTLEVDPSGKMSLGGLHGWYEYRGLREAGKSPEDAARLMADRAKAEAAMAAVALPTGALLCAAGPEIEAAVLSGLRWLNRGKFRIGPSKHMGTWRISIRWKNKHWDLPWIRW